MQLRQRLRKGTTIAAIALSSFASLNEVYSTEHIQEAETVEEITNESWEIHFAGRIINWTGEPYFRPEKIETGRNELILPSWSAWLEFPTRVNSNWSSNIVLNLRKPMDLDKIDLSDINKKTIITEKEITVDEIVFNYEPENRLVENVRGGVFQQYFLSNTKPWDRTSILQPALTDSLPTSDFGLELRLGFNGVSVIGSAMLSPREDGYENERGDSHLVGYFRAEKKLDDYTLFFGRRESRENVDLLIGGIERDTPSSRTYLTYLDEEGTKQMEVYAELRSPFNFWQFQEAIVYGSYESVIGPNRINLGVRGNLGNHFWYKMQGVKQEETLWGILEIGVDWTN